MGERKRNTGTSEFPMSRIVKVFPFYSILFSSETKTTCDRDVHTSYSELKSLIFIPLFATNGYVVVVYHRQLLCYQQQLLHL